MTKRDGAPASAGEDDRPDSHDALVDASFHASPGEALGETTTRWDSWLSVSEHVHGMADEYSAAALQVLKVILCLVVLCWLVTQIDEVDVKDVLHVVPDASIDLLIGSATTALGFGGVSWARRRHRDRD